MKAEILSILHRAEGPVSAEALSRELDVLPAALEEYVEQLRAQGYGIEEVPGKGFFLSDVPDPVNETVLLDGQKTTFFGKTVSYLPSTDSTNNLAKQHPDSPDGTLFVADFQSCGRGRRGNVWVSSKGDGIWMSLLLKPDLPPETVSQLTLVAGLAVCNVLNRYLPDHSAQIKWPNDVVVGGKKICGILTERITGADAEGVVVVGIGINVNTRRFDESLSQKATSLWLETGIFHLRADIINHILLEFETHYLAFLQTGFAAMRKDYAKTCVTVGKDVLILQNNSSTPAKAVDIAPDGALIIEKDGGRECVNSGEVSVRGILGYV